MGDWKYKFQKPIYPIEEYIDAEFMVLGKRESRQDVIVTDGPFSINIAHTAMIDGGDSTFHCGHYLTAGHLLGENVIHRDPPLTERLYLGSGYYCRHPDKKMWYSDKYRVGRDQQKSIISAESFIKGSWKRVIPFMLRHATRLFLFEAKLKDNGNHKWKFPAITGPTIWASYLRYFMMKSKIFFVFYPLLLLFDLEILLNLFVKTRIDKDDTDVLNHINYSIWFHYVAPTPWTYLNLKLMDKENFRLRLFKYYDDGRCPYFIANMWSDVMDRYMK